MLEGQAFAVRNICIVLMMAGPSWRLAVLALQFGHIEALVRVGGDILWDYLTEEVRSLVRKKLPKYREHMNLVQGHEVSIRGEERC